MSVVVIPPQTNRTYRFGDFEFSVRDLELRKGGEPVRLQQQPLKVLHALLDHSNETTTREEIRERVWPNSPISDFDNSLRVAINKLRVALGDNSEFPKYIETLPRRGYRWVAPVTFEDHLPAAMEHSGHSGMSNHDDTLVDGLFEKQRGNSRVPWRSFAFSFLLVLTAFAAERYLKPSHPEGELSVMPLTTYPGSEYMPALSPDGTRVAFAWTGPNPGDPYTLYFKYLNDERPHRLAEPANGGSDSDPVWAPDGKSVYFYRRGGAQPGIYLVSAEGGTATLVTQTALHNRRIRRARFDISPDGKSLVYPDAVPGKDTIALFVMDLTSKQASQISDPPPGSEGDGDPAYSHDGKNVAYLRNNLDMQQVLVVPTAGGVSRALLSEVLTEFFDGLAWSSDDREIIIGGKQLRRVAASGGDGSSTAVQNVPGPALFPSLRRDKLAYVQASMNANIWKLNLSDGVRPAGEPVKLISSTRQQAAASYSPDGTRIAFQSDRTGNWEIWVSNRDGSDAVQLTHFNNAPAGTPRWSPDGKYIVFDARGTGMPQIYAVPADGGDPRQITNEAAGAEVPSWSRDGKWIYYTTSVGGILNIWKISPQGGHAQQVTRNGGIYPVESYNGRYLYYSRSSTDSTIWRLPLAGGPEELAPGAPKPVDCSHWALTDSGIYAVVSTGDLVFQPFGHSKATTILHDQRLLTDWSMAVAPDGREVIWAQIDLRNADLMLVENFH